MTKGTTMKNVSRSLARLGVEALEDRTVLSTVFALSTSNQLLTFDSSAPGTILNLAPVTGLKTDVNQTDTVLTHGCDRSVALTTR